MLEIKNIEGVTIRESKGMLCLTDLITANELVSCRFESSRSIYDFFNSSDEVEYVEEILLLQESITNDDISGFRDSVHRVGLLNTLKCMGKYEMKGRGENRRVFCDPYLFIAVAQWLNPRFRAYVTMWVTDSLILDRIEAGELYKGLGVSIKDYIVPTLSDNGRKFIYSNIAKLVNKKVFGEHRDDLRQSASKSQLKELNETELLLSELIKLKMLSSYQEIKDYLNK